MTANAAALGLNTLTFVVDDQGITIAGGPRRGPNDDQGAGVVDKVWGNCGDKIVFTIVNKSTQVQKVTIPPVEIVPSHKFEPRAKPFPLTSGQHTIVLKPGDTGTITVVVKPHEHFDFKSFPAKGMTYKFTVYSNEHFLDPDLEINP